LILKKIKEIDYNVLNNRPRITNIDKINLITKTIFNRDIG